MIVKRWHSLTKERGQARLPNLETAWPSNADQLEGLPRRSSNTHVTSAQGQEGWLAPALD